MVGGAAGVEESNNVERYQLPIHRDVLPGIFSSYALLVIFQGYRLLFSFLRSMVKSDVTALFDIFSSSFNSPTTASLDSSVPFWEMSQGGRSGVVVYFLRACLCCRISMDDFVLDLFSFKSRGAGGDVKGGFMVIGNHLLFSVSLVEVSRCHLISTYEVSLLVFPGFHVLRLGPMSCRTSSVDNE